MDNPSQDTWASGYGIMVRGVVGEAVAPPACGNECGGEGEGGRSGDGFVHL